VWRKTGSTTPNATRAPDLTVNLGLPDGSGFTQCSHDYYHIYMSLETFNPASSASPTPEAYEFRIAGQPVSVAVTARSALIKFSLRTSDLIEIKLRQAEAARQAEVCWKALRQSKPGSRGARDDNGSGVGSDFNRAEAG
jgi:hypothetical protein